MAYFFFVDESGIDKNPHAYEVLCGISIEDKDIWNFVSRAKELETQFLGVRYSSSGKEIKGRKFLDRQTFRQSRLWEKISVAERLPLAKSCLETGAGASRREIAALAQAKLDYVRALLSLCATFRVKVFASISGEDVTREYSKDDNLLRRDYVYLFERIFYFLDDKRGNDQGIIVFDEIEKSQSHILISLLENYFKKTAKGRQRSSLVIPEPFFVHSDLTTGIQVADIIAYILSWNFRLSKMDKQKREELNEFTESIMPLRYRTMRDVGDADSREVWSVTFVK